MPLPVGSADLPPSCHTKLRFVKSVKQENGGNEAIAISHRMTAMRMSNQ